jgi:hypothetical protein
MNDSVILLFYQKFIKFLEILIDSLHVPDNRPGAPVNHGNKLIEDNFFRRREHPDRTVGHVHHFSPDIQFLGNSPDAAPEPDFLDPARYVDFYGLHAGSVPHGDRDPGIPWHLNGPDKTGSILYRKECKKVE